MTSVPVKYAIDRCRFRCNKVIASFRCLSCKGRIPGGDTLMDIRTDSKDKLPHSHFKKGSAFC
ncbi:hypothetical protein HMPREF9012_1718 [Bacteroidetes bacterium oral taxon 272 str. F0290]|nr:hypothetical protein HMPREF9012_1718 [Bacteroidetes bacterium oral taxon 272 str. F0290]